MDTIVGDENTGRRVGGVSKTEGWCWASSSESTSHVDVEVDWYGLNMKRDRSEERHCITIVDDGFKLCNYGIYIVYIYLLGWLLSFTCSKNPILKFTPQPWRACLHQGTLRRSSLYGHGKELVHFWWPPHNTCQHSWRNQLKIWNISCPNDFIYPKHPLKPSPVNGALSIFGEWPIWWWSVENKFPG